MAREARMVKRRVGSLATVGFIAGCLLSVAMRPRTAEAYYVRTSAASCKPEKSTNAYDVSPSATDSRLRNPNSFEVYYLCDLPDTSDLPRSSISLIHAYVVDANDNSLAQYAHARACTVDVNDGLGGDCGTLAHSGPSTGFAQLNPGTEALDTGDRGYLVVSLPARDTTDPVIESGYSSILGFFFRD